MLLQLTVRHFTAECNRFSRNNNKVWVIPELYDFLCSIMPASTPVPSDFGKISEPGLLGHLLQWALFGVLSVQVYIYYLAFPDEPLRRKLLVYAVYVIEMAQAIMLARMAYIQFAAGFGKFEVLDAIPAVLWFGVPILSSIVAAVVQIFYACRIKFLAESYLIPSVVVLLALLQLGGGITLGVLCAKTPYFSKVLGMKIYIAAGMLYGGSAVCDVLIAAYMTYLLSQRKSDFKQTQRLIHKIMRLTIGTGMLTAALAIINLVLVLMPSKPTYFETTTEVLGKMYSNTMMVLLNSRFTYGITNESNRPSFVLTSLTPQVGVPATHEQRLDPLEHPPEIDRQL